MKYYLGCTSDKIWNMSDFIKFLASNQKKSIEIQLQPEAISCDVIDLYKILDCFQFKSVKIYTGNPFEKHNYYEIITSPMDIWATPQDIDLNLHTWNKEKIFYCLFGRPTASRLGLASFCYTRHQHNSLIHFSFGTSDDEKIHFELDKLFEYETDAIKNVSKIIDKMPLKLSHTQNYTSYNGYEYKDKLTNFYQDILVDIVVESHVKGNTFFPTEKTFRPILLKKPFITFASKNFLCYLRQMGFRTFADFWNEDYDGYEGKDRYKKICNLIDQISKKSKDELEKMYWDMAYTLDYNYNLLQDQLYSSKISEI